MELLYDALGVYRKLEKEVPCLRLLYLQVRRRMVITAELFSFSLGLVDLISVSKENENSPMKITSVKSVCQTRRRLAGKKKKEQPLG